MGQRKLRRSAFQTAVLEAISPEDVPQHARSLAELSEVAAAG